MQLLELIQTAMGELGLNEPNAVATSSDRLVKQFLRLVNKVGNSIITDAAWEGLHKEHRFDTNVVTEIGTLTADSPIITGIADTSSIEADTFMATGDNIPADSIVLSVDSGTQVTLSRAVSNSAVGQAIVFTQTKYILPTDYQRSVNRTHWDQTNHWELLGPRSAQEWQFLKSGIISTGPRTRYRIVDKQFQIWPPNIGTYRLGYEYISKAWVDPASGNSKTKFTLDTDEALFEDRTLIDGVKFEFYSVKGFDPKTFERAFKIQKAKEIAQDSPAPTLSLNSPTSFEFIGGGSVPDTGYGT